jgi:hypothetical protein
MGEKVTVKGKFNYDKDTFRYHRFLVKGEEGLTGVIYVRRDRDVPEKVVLERGSN